jgi:alkylation response protein AidB-like acyl-CoA dehydrogenase
MWISNAGFCSVFIVFARIGDDKILPVLSLKTIQVMELQ